MPRFSHADFQDGGPNYLKANCNKVILASAYTTDYATANTTNKVAEAALVNGDFTLAGAAGAARVLTIALLGKAGGNALMSLADGSGMHLIFVDTTASKVLYVTEESLNQSVTSGLPVAFASNVTYSCGQPTA